MEYNFVVDFLTREALEQCSFQDISVPRPLMQFMIKWLVISSGEHLLNADEETTLAIYQSIYDQIIDNGPVIQILKLRHFFEDCTFEHASVQEKYEKITQDKLLPLLENICSSNGTTKKDHDELIKKITTYIVASNKMFNPKNSEMLSLAKAALQSILTKQDIIDFIGRKKRFQIDNLQCLGKIMCGILLFNKHIGQGGEAIRDVVGDIHMAYENTLEALRLSMKKCSEYIKIGLRAVSSSVTIDLDENKLIYKLPEGISIDDLEFFNKFNYLYLQHELYLKKLKEHVISLKSLIDHDAGQLKELIFKLHDVVKFRLAVPSDSVFPHFTKLFETWYQILLKLYFLVEINLINDRMAEIVETEYPFEEMASKIGSMESIVTSKVDLMDMTDECEQEPVRRIKTKTDTLATNQLQRYCALTMAASNGILLPSDSKYGLLPLNNQFIAFKRRNYLAFAEKNYNSVVKSFLRTTFQNPEMCLLFDISIEESPLNRPHFYEKKKSSKKKTFDAGIQTEHCLPAASLGSKNSYSWNLWDYRRRAIQLANLKKCKTHSTQTNLTYSSKDAAIQTYKKVSSTHRCNDSSSQLSKSVCQKLD